MPTVEEMKAQLIAAVKSGQWKLDDLFQLARVTTHAAEDLALSKITAVISNMKYTQMEIMLELLLASNYQNMVMRPQPWSWLLQECHLTVGILNALIAKSLLLLPMKSFNA